MKSTLLAALLASSIVTLDAQSQSQSRKDPMGKPPGSNNAACALLNAPEVAKLVGRRSYVEEGLGLGLVGGGFQCSYDVGAWVSLYSGPSAAARYDSLGKTTKGEVLARQAVADVGDSAYVAVLPGDEYPGQHARLHLVVRQGTHVVAFTLNAPDGQKPAAVQPQLVAMAKAALARLPK